MDLTGKPEGPSVRAFSLALAACAVVGVAFAGLAPAAKDPMESSSAPRGFVRQNVLIGDGG